MYFIKNGESLSLKITCFLMACCQRINKKEEKIYWPNHLHKMMIFQTRTSKLSCEFVSSVPRLLVPMAVHALAPLPVVANDIWFSS